MKTVNHENFDLVMEAVEAGDAVVVIASYTKPKLINKKVVLKFKKAGYTVIKKDADGRGFRFQCGKSNLYVPINALFFVVAE